MRPPRRWASPNTAHGFALRRAWRAALAEGFRCERLQRTPALRESRARARPLALAAPPLSRLSHRSGVNPQRPAARPGGLNTLQTPHGVRGTARNSPGRAGWPGLWRGRGRQWRRRCRRGFDELMAPAAPVRTDERGCRNLPARGKEHAKMVRLEVVVCTAFMFACAIDRRAEQVQNTGMG